MTRTLALLRPSVLAMLLAAVTAAAAAAQPQAGPPPPKVAVSIVRIDPGNFPDVDVYFRVVDTVPSSTFHPPVPADVKVAETPDGGGGGFQAAQVVDTNFAKPDLRPLALTLAVDRSNSVKPILSKIKEATLRWLNGMSDNGQLPDDQTALNLFAGGNNLKKLLHQPLTADKAAVLAFADANLDRTDGGTPLHKAWNLSVRDESESDYDARGVLMLTDGKNAPRNAGPKVKSIIQAAVSNGLPMFNFAFVKFKGAGKLARNSVYRPDMIEMAERTKGAYFEPIPPFPLLPDLPDEPDDKASAEALPDEDAIEYVRQVLGMVKNLLTNDPDARFEDFSSAINLLVEPDVATQADFLNLDLSSDTTLAQGASTLTYQDLVAIDAQLEASSKATVSEEDLRTFYVDQVENMFTKVRTSLKNLYRVTFRSPFPELGGKPRDVRVSIAYTTDVNALPLALSGQDIGRYITPVLADEDAQVEVQSSLNPSSPVHDLLFGAGEAPRGGTWSGATEIGYQVELCGPNADNRPAVYARRSPDGQVTIADSPEAAALDSADRQALTTYLTHLAFEAVPDVATGMLGVKLTGKIPTCVRDTSSLRHRPLENKSAPGFRKMLWYRIVPQATRGYDYTLTVPTSEGQPGDETPSKGVVKEELPVLIVFVIDSTPPSMTLYLTPSRDSVQNRIGTLELPLDTAARPRPFTALLTGNGWLAGLDSGFAEAASPAVTMFPLTVDGKTVQGFFINEDVRVTAALLAQDNYDRNADASHVATPGSTAAVHVRFRDTDPTSSVGQKGETPFLAHLQPSEFGTKPGASLLIDENGTRGPVVDSVIFRAPNVPSGDPVAFECRAMDESKNVAIFRVPVFVMPVGFDIKNIQFESQRGK
ncbi:MAG: hypothetical protein HY816_20745 [Candidatus Wallbacteria bacterium]|nr:hypothetical protein [Candidatus Wallbacteria bacterium]